MSGKLATCRKTKTTVSWDQIVLGEQKMRVKISVKDHQNLQNINIQDLELLDEFNEGLPKAYFKSQLFDTHKSAKHL